MASLWQEITRAEEIVTVGTGTANAVHFARGAIAARGPRRRAALLLATLLAGSALDAAALLTLGPAGASAAVARLPLLLGNLAVFSLVLAGSRR